MTVVFWMDSAGVVTPDSAGAVSEGVASGVLFSVWFSSREAGAAASVQPPVNNPVISSAESMIAMGFFFIVRFPLSIDGVDIC